MSDLKGKTAVITGASKGIGRATALHLASLGYDVVLAARNEKALSDVATQIKNAGANALVYRCDVAKFEDVATLMDHAIAQFGNVDIVVNNAGVIDPIARLADSDPKDWAHVMEVNILGVYHAIRSALPHMLHQGEGVIINLSSGAATSALEGWSHYCASKSAVLSLTKVTHREYGQHGIRCVGLSPGTVATDMQATIKASGINPVSQLAASAHISTDWVARAIAYLAGPDGQAHAGGDFSLKTPEGRAAIGLSGS